MIAIRCLVPLTNVTENPWQTRPIDQEKANALAADIRQNGLLQPPVGRVVNLAGQPVPERWWALHDVRDGEQLAKVLVETGFSVQIAFGHHRFAAFKLLYTDLVPDYMERFGRFPVDVQELTDEQMAMFGWSENEQRGDLNEVQKAEAIQRYIKDFGWTQEQVAQKLGVSRPTVANKVRLLKLRDNELTRPVFEALRDGKISERQAMPALAFLDQPAEVIERSESKDYAWQRPSSKIAEIIKGDTPSDRLRDNIEDTIVAGMANLEGCPFLDLPFEGDGYVKSQCRDCKLNVKFRNRIMCQQPSCFDRKNIAWQSASAAAALEATGLELISEDTRYGDYKDFWGDEREVMVDLFQRRRCPNMRLKRGRGATVPGADGYELVCLHGGSSRRCKCLEEEIRRRKKEDPKELAKEAAKKEVKVLSSAATETLTGALVALSQPVWYQLAKKELYNLKDLKIKPDTSAMDIIRVFARRLIENQLPDYMYEQRPDEARKKIAEFFASMGIKPDGTQLTPAESAASKFERIQNWMADLPREFPTKEMVRGNIANLEKLIETPGLEEAQWQPMTAARDLLEKILPIVEAWTAEDAFREVTYLITTSNQDPGFKMSLDKATGRMIEYALALIPEAENKGKIKALTSRLNKLRKEAEDRLSEQTKADVYMPGKLPGETLIEYFKRTDQLEDSNANNGNELVSSF